MKAWDYNAVTYDGAVYCIGCLPKGVKEEDDEVRPIFASEEWQCPGPTCDSCHELHDYMGILHDGCKHASKTTDDDECCSGTVKK